MKRNRSSLASSHDGILTCSESQFESQFDMWCDQVESRLDFSIVPIILQRSIPSSCSAKITKLISFTMDSLVSQHNSQALNALFVILHLQVVPTRLLSKHHSALVDYLVSKKSTHVLSARCFALLPLLLPKPDWLKQFELLMQWFNSALNKKDLIEFQLSSSAMLEFLTLKGKMVQPLALIKSCRRALDVNSSFADVALHVLRHLVKRLKRVGLSWSNHLCEILDLAWEQPELKLACYQTLAVFQRCFGLVVVNKFSTVLLSSLKWEKGAGGGEKHVSASLECVSTLFHAGGGLLLSSNVRRELDQWVLHGATSALWKQKSSAALQAQWLETLMLVCISPLNTREDSAVLSQAIDVFQRVLSTKGKPDAVVKPMARLGLMNCSFRLTVSSFPHVFVSDDDGVKDYTLVLPSMQEEEEEEEEGPVEESEEATQEEGNDNEEEENANEENEEEEEALVVAVVADITPSAKRVHLDAGLPKKEDYEEEDSDNDIPDIIQ